MASTPLYSCRYTRSALRQLRKCPKREQITNWFRQAVGDPFRKDTNIKPLSGVAQGYRRRFGDWRVSYYVDQQGRVIEVFEIAPRGGAYR
ncbi:MAG TPA: type II toxin-antitoxin system RelE/ParE family toxin [Rhodospirillales bacterium]|nr:type II toxin-antitoxin system RelE/ParE family toxin [Rhodospirillales bacterium]